MYLTFADDGKGKDSGRGMAIAFGGGAALLLGVTFMVFLKSWGKKNDGKFNIYKFKSGAFGFLKLLENYIIKYYNLVQIVEKGRTMHLFVVYINLVGGNHDHG